MMDETAFDLELFEQWRCGRAAAGERLLARYVAPVFRFFSRRVGDDAEELSQRTFESLVKSAARFERRSSFRAYLFGIARRQLLRHRRTAWSTTVAWDPCSASLTDRGTSPSAAASLKQEATVLLEALRRLSLDLRVTLELFYWEGLSQAEIARATRVAEGTVKSRLHRAKLALRSEYLRILDSKSTGEPRVPPSVVER